MVAEGFDVEVDGLADILLKFFNSVAAGSAAGQVWDVRRIAPIVGFFEDDFVFGDHDKIIAAKFAFRRATLAGGIVVGQKGSTQREAAKRLQCRADWWRRGLHKDTSR